jgi:hypothetical protein
MEVKLKGGKMKIVKTSKLIKTKSISSKTTKTNALNSHHSGVMFLKGLKKSFEIMKEERKGFKKGVVKLNNKANPNMFDDFVNKLLKNNKNKPFNFVSAPSKL